MEDNIERLQVGLKDKKKRVEGSWIDVRDGVRPVDDEEDPLLTDEYLGLHQKVDDGANIKRFSEVPKIASGTVLRRKTVGGSVHTKGSKESQTSHHTHGHHEHEEEFHNFRLFSHEMGFDLELWWRRSGIYTRLLGLMVVFLFFIMIIHLLGSVYFVVAWIMERPPSPYVCKTERCQKAAIWMNESMNREVNPCDNFYEFMCGNYKEDQETDAIFEQVLTKPGFKLEFGEESVLARVLRNFKDGNELYNQPIRYYQSCLDEGPRKKQSLDAFLENVEYVFGTRDLSKEIPYNMSEVGANLFRTVGHAYFINFAFYTYPFIQFVEPTEATLQLNYRYDGSNAIFVEKVLRGLLPHLGFNKNSPDFNETITKMVDQVGVFSRLINALYYLPVEEKQFIELTCPLYGQVLKYSGGPGSVLNLFFNEEPYRVQMLSPFTARYLNSFVWCFRPGPPNPSWTLRRSIVLTWLVLMFDEFANVMSKDMLDEWGFNEIPNNTFVNNLNHILQQSAETRCLKGLWQGLGYLPSILYLTSDEFMQRWASPARRIQQIQELLQAMYFLVREEFANIPRNEISDHARDFGIAIFRRPFFAHVVMPMVGMRVDASLDNLNFTDDYIRNKFIARRYTVLKGMDYWIASTNTFPAMKWWGQGSPGDIKNELLDLRFPMIISARLHESVGAARRQEFELFLLRKSQNYILFPLTLLFPPFGGDTLAFAQATEAFKAVASMLALLEEAQTPSKYRLIDRQSRLSGWNMLLNITDDQRNSTNYTCWIMLTHDPKRPEDKLYLYRQQGLDKNLFTWKADDKYLTVVAAKIAYKRFRDEREFFKAQRITWNMSPTWNKFIFNRQLPGKYFRNFTEEQLFFMAFARHTCRASWKKYPETDWTRRRRYFLESLVLHVLMQMKEFSEVWGCSGNSLMNNYGKNRCMNWVPPVQRHEQKRPK